MFLVSHYRSSGGHESVLDNLAKGLARLGYRVMIGSFSFEDNPPEDISILNLSKPRDIVYSIKNTDIIHCHHAKMNYCSLLSSKPFIFHWHGASKKVQEINMRLSLMLCRNRISRLIFVSNYSMSSMKGGGLNIPCNVIYHGVDTSFYKSNLPRKYKVGDPQLLFVGNLYSYKNISRIIDEIPAMLQPFPNLQLQIVGHGDDYRRLERELKKKKLEKHVELVGKVTDKEELRLRYASCDLYVSASTIESFGLPLIEAMACGRPILVSDIPAHEELVRASAAGLTFSLCDKHGIRNALNDILNNKNQYTINAMDFAKKNDWSNVCIKISEIYQEVTASH